jgi:hypothetical protein
LVMGLKSLNAIKAQPHLGGHGEAINPQTEYDFALAMAVGLHDRHPEVTPIYDEVGNLTGWRGITLRDPNF